MFSKCFVCKKTKLFLKKASFKLPTGQTVHSRDKMCKSCYKKTISKML